MFTKCNLKTSKNVLRLNRLKNKQVQSWLSFSSKLGVLTWRVPIQSRHLDPNIKKEYRIYSINRPERVLNFWILRVGVY